MGGHSAVCEMSFKVNKIISGFFNQQYITSGANLGIPIADMGNLIHINFISTLSLYDDLGLASDISRDLSRTVDSAEQIENQRYQFGFTP